MHHVDTYLRRVAFWLPGRNRDDILAELRDAIGLRIDEAAQEKGAQLDDPEVERILRGFGHPATVLARYVERRPVISSMLAFFYWRVLAIVMAGIAAVQAVVLTATLASAGPASALIHDALVRLAVAGLIGFACVTISFIILDRRYGEPGNGFV